MKEVVGVLDRVVRDEAIDRIIVACDEVARPLLMEQLPKELAAKVVDIVHADIRTPEHRVLAETLEALGQRDAETDGEHVEAMLSAWRQGGLAVVGPEDTLDALARGQVEELLIVARPEALRPPNRVPPDAAPGPIDIETSAPQTGLDSARAKLAGELVARAQQNGARVRFIEDASLLSDAGGVGATLRFRI